MITISRTIMTNTRTLETGRVPRRSTSEIPILEPEEIDQICMKAVYPRDSCLIALLYLIGRRIGEVVPLRLGDFVTSNPRVITVKTFNEKSFRQTRAGRYNIVKHGDYKMKKKDGTIVNYDTRYYESIEPSFSTQGPSGKLLGHYVTNYLFLLKYDGGDYLFPPYRRSSGEHIKQSRSYQILRALDERLWLHAMRHMDFTRMARVYKKNPVAMHRLTFHKRFESTLEYIHEEGKGDNLAKL